MACIDTDKTTSVGQRPSDLGSSGLGLGIGSICAGDTLLQRLPEQRDVQAARDPHALLGGREEAGGDLAGPGAGRRVLVGALGDDRDLVALPLRQARLSRRIAVAERNLVLVAEAGQDGGDGEGVVQWRAFGDAEDVTCDTSQSVLSPEDETGKERKERKPTYTSLQKTSTTPPT